MDVIAKAKELGESIGASQQFIDFKKTEIDVEKDAKAKQLLNDFKLLQIELVKATKGKKGAEIIESIKERLTLKQDEINNYDTTKKYFNAKSSFDRLMKTINDVIIFSITGEEPCSPNKCSTCGGGCK